MPPSVPKARAMTGESTIDKLRSVGFQTATVTVEAERDFMRLSEFGSFKTVRFLSATCVLY